jgi:phage terminase small subunit
VVTKPGGEDENGNRVVEHVHKLKVWDKNSALEKIAKHLGMFIDRHEHSGPGGAPIQTKGSLDATGLTMDQLRVLAAIRTGDDSASGNS